MKSFPSLTMVMQADYLNKSVVPFYAHFHCVHGKLGLLSALCILLVLHYKKQKLIISKGKYKKNSKV